ncbi:hypothetical protein IH980_01680 [Patescibacteria group bacterium]|nr:hypothetical protein [Patescibacteria group bacterium]
MRKELVIVIVIGILIGSIVAYGIYTAQTAIKQYQLQKISVEDQPKAEPSPQITHTLTITEPTNESISDQEEITVVGKTTPNAVITIIAEENEYLLTADGEGNFTAEISLVGGANEITITAFDNDGNRAEQLITVVYSTAEL